ncbi:MAG TPA: hypothetical protein DDW52_05255 [Planctomycetaceae bacterium]|nr:hypothetical protein [Planctomycetaceae bacterium]
MLDTNTNTTQTASNKEHIWEGSVGVCIEQRENRKTGKPFYTFELTRCFRREGNDKFEYSHSFTERNAEALRKVIDKAVARISSGKQSAETTEAVEQ